MSIEKAWSIIIITALIIGACFFGYKGYLTYQEWKNPKIETIKTVVEPLPEKTYIGIKDRVIELNKDPEANKVEIKELRIDLSKERQAFLASDDTILIKTTDGKTLLIYRNEEEILQAASDNIEKIIEHRDIVVLPEEISISDKDWGIKAGGYYSFDNSYGIIISKEVFDIGKWSLNASALINNFKDYKFSIGGDIGVEIRDNLELGAGYSTNKEFYVKIQYKF